MDLWNVHVCMCECVYVSLNIYICISEEGTDCEDGDSDKDW